LKVESQELKYKNLIKFRRQYCMDKKHSHVHSGKSTQNIINAEEVLKNAGIKSGDVFLDAGCGDGYISIEASKMVGKQGRVYAVDVYPESIETVKTKIRDNDFNNMEAVLADITENIPLNDDSVDHVMMANVLHGFVAENEVEPVMDNINRIIKSGGIFSVVEFRKIENNPGPPFDVKLSSEQVIEILAQYGFDTINTQKIGTFHYIVNGLRKP
jgi:ubiquinone/menaquinone biosynthesis C-methylase UbiE